MPAPIQLPASLDSSLKFIPSVYNPAKIPGVPIQTQDYLSVTDESAAYLAANGVSGFVTTGATYDGAATIAAVERVNISKGYPVLQDRQRLIIKGEGGMHRHWDAAAQNFWFVQVSPGVSVTLGSDTAKITVVTVGPTGGTAGDHAVYYTANQIYKNTSGTWAVLQAAMASSVAGATGPQGATGPTGATGPQGATGAAGATTFAGLTDAATAPIASTNTSVANIASTVSGHTTAIAGLAPIASPTFTGTPTSPTPGTADSTTKIATTAMVQAAVAAGNTSTFIALTDAATAPIATTNTSVATALALRAPLASPSFTGTPAAPTAAPGTNTTQLATMAALQAAVAALGVGMRLKGAFDASASPNYPAGTAGDVYFISPAGKVGGTSGKIVDASDMLICNVTSAAGAEAAVGANWFVVEHNLIGALVAANNLSDLTNAATAWANLGGDAKAQTANASAIAVNTNAIALLPTNASLSSGNIARFDFHFETFAALQTAVAAEQARVAASAARWVDGTRLNVGTAPNTVTMIWSVANNHARLASFGSGKTLALTGDANVVLFAAGVPASSTGANGDASVDWAVGVYGPKAAGAWNSTPAVTFASSSAATIPGTTLLIDNGAILIDGGYLEIA